MSTSRELALLHPLVKPGAPEDEAPQPVDEALVRGADEVIPVLVHVLAEAGAGFADLAVHRQLQEVLELMLVEPLVNEVELHRRLLDPLGEVALVEREAELPVLEHVIGARFVISSACGLVHEVTESLRMSGVVASDPLGLNVHLQQKGSRGERRRFASETRSRRDGR
jgi:hypothetical protein